MPTPFPGMNPWLEHPQLWSGVHSSLIVYLRDQLNPTLRPRYIAAVEERVFVEGPDRRVIPDVWIRKTHRSRPSPEDSAEGGVAVAVAVEAETEDEPVIVVSPGLEVHETYIEILDLHANKRLVTVIELVSPTNKTAGPGRDSYRAKQLEVLKSDVHLVEIDLLRDGSHVLAVPEELARARCGDNYDYLTCVTRAIGLREQHELYASRLPQRLPRIRIPLAGNDPDVRLDIQKEIDRLIDLGGYDDRIDYTQPCEPPLSPENEAWMQQKLAAHAQPTESSSPTPAP